MRLFFDFEFTPGLRKNPDLLSLGIVAEDNRAFYAETDYDEEQASAWVKANVIPHLELEEMPWNSIQTQDGLTQVYGEKTFIRGSLLTWLSQFNNIEFWGDCLAWDWILLHDLMATYDDEGNPSLPKNILVAYPNDLFGLFQECGFSTADAWNIDKAEFVGLVGSKRRKQTIHHGLAEAKVMKATYFKLMEIKAEYAKINPGTS